jgi:hypothetical protein
MRVNELARGNHKIKNKDRGLNRLTEISMFVNQFSNDAEEEPNMMVQN